MSAKQAGLLWGIVLGFILMYLYRSYQARSSRKG